jgi:hypothetical protein
MKILKAVSHHLFMMPIILCPLTHRGPDQPLEALLNMLGEQQSGLREYLDAQRLKVLAEKVETERRVRFVFSCVSVCVCVCVETGRSCKCWANS